MDRRTLASIKPTDVLVLEIRTWPVGVNAAPLRVEGAGTGYDVQSFNGDGSSRLIEVKTTGLGKYFPFNVTVNEVRCSQPGPRVPSVPSFQLRT